MKAFSESMTDGARAERMSCRSSRRKVLAVMRDQRLVLGEAGPSEKAEIDGTPGKREYAVEQGGLAHSGRDASACQNAEVKAQTVRDCHRENGNRARAAGVRTR